ncbi:MAG: TonB-dependent receptor [Cellvibrionaceae bacterium]|nr:TonB-dependent receptor [Cellvibrionaceae bacterium]
MSRALSPAQSVFKKPLYLAITLLCASGAASAQTGESKILEEVLVTAQKRVQTLQEVPISVAAVTGDKIERMGVENLEDLTAYVPNIHFTETGLSTQMRIRGIGSDNSQGFEQSVGVYKDGIYHSRAQLFRAPMFDVERVEVMRGPQGTLFGKNSIAGAVDIIAAKPTEDFEGRVTGSYESEFKTKELNGFVSGPLSDTLNGRLAVRYYDDPGFMVNTFKNRDEPDSEEKSVRGSLAWEASDNLDFVLIAEHNSFDVLGRAIEVTQDLPSVADDFPPRGLTYQQILSGFGATFDSNADYRRQSNSPEFSNNKIDSLTLRADYQMGDYTLTSLTGGLRFDYKENCDCDFTPVDFFHLDMYEDYEQFSQEIRIASPEDRSFTWIGGLFYQTYDQTFNDDFNIPQASPLSLLVNPALANTRIARHFNQGSDTWAIFAEGTWRATDKLALTLGARFTEEDKDAHKTMNIESLVTGDVINSPTLAGLFALVFNTDTEQGTGHNLNASRSESAFTPAFTISYDVSDDVMTYGKISKGFKAGGFDPRTNKADRFEFEEEKVTAIELGSKMRFMEGRSELNVAIFHMDYEDLQVSQFDGAVGFNIGNANSTIVQGIELDGRMQVTNHLTASYGAAVLDFEYEDFTNGNCYFGQTSDSTVGTDEFCDYTGLRGVYSPEITLNLGFQYVRPIGAIDFVAGVDAQWVDKQQVHVNLDPRGEIDAYTMLDARLGIEGDNWELALLGKNLLDEEIISYSANMPLSEQLFETNTYYSFLRRPRTIALEATFKF